MFISCNPDPDSFLADYVDWWLDDEGFPDPEKSGKLKYYVIESGKPVFADTREELEKSHRHLVYLINTKTNKEQYVPPKSITFIGGTIFDNQALIDLNPNYLAELNSLPSVERDRLLLGNWYARPQGSSFFQREWLIEADNYPAQIAICRAWDKAATEPSEVNYFPDYTAGVKMAKDKNGNFYLIGDYCENNHDKAAPDVKGRFRERSGTRDNLILDQAIHDGKNCTVVFSQDPGSAGVTEFQESSKKLTTAGFYVKKDPMPTQTGKLTRFLPFASACENKCVYIVSRTFNKPTLEAIYKELEAFDGERSTRQRKDDIPDAIASAFNHLCKTATIPAFTLEEFTRDNPFSF